MKNRVVSGYLYDPNFAIRRVDNRTHAFHGLEPCGQSYVNTLNFGKKLSTRLLNSASRVDYSGREWTRTIDLTDVNRAL